jgi:hypothetical protein
MERKCECKDGEFNSTGNTIRHDLNYISLPKGNCQSDIQQTQKSGYPQGDRNHINPLREQQRRAHLRDHC